MNYSCAALREQGPPCLHPPALTSFLAPDGRPQPQAEPDVGAWAQLDPLPSSHCKTATGGSFINTEADVASAALCVLTGELRGEKVWEETKPGAFITQLWATSGLWQLWLV